MVYQYRNLSLTDDFAIIVTGPAKIGHVGTNYTLSHNMSYLRIGIEYFHFVTCIVKPTKCDKCLNFHGYRHGVQSYEKAGNFYVPTCPIFAGPVTIIDEDITDQDPYPFQ